MQKSRDPDFISGLPLAPRWLFARHLAINISIAVALILVSLAIGMIGYHWLGFDWLRSFGHAAMILGGMGLTRSPKPMGESCLKASTRSIQACC